MLTTVLDPHSDGYPYAMKRWPGGPNSEPPRLYLRGQLPRGPGVAIVGARDASRGAMRFTAELAGAACKAGFSIWSGGAVGIDGQAHRSALDCSTPTVAVLAGGLDQAPFPREHATLFEQIVATGGALLSLHPDGTRRLNYHFQQRNRLIAALALATVMVEGTSKSGARGAMGAARRMGRPTFAVPHAPWSTRGAGCIAELAIGARPVLHAAGFTAALTQTRHAGGQLRLLWDERPGPRPHSLELRPQIEVKHADAPADDERGANSIERRLLNALSGVPCHIDALCERARLPYAEVGPAIMGLNLDGRVVEVAAGIYRLSAP